MITFEEVGIERKILKAIDDLGFKTKMPVQDQVIPHLLNNEKKRERFSVEAIKRVQDFEAKKIVTQYTELF